jgi:hypothetical protein
VNETQDSRPLIRISAMGEETILPGGVEQLSKELGVSVAALRLFIKRKFEIAGFKYEYADEGEDTCGKQGQGN